VTSIADPETGECQIPYMI